MNCLRGLNWHGNCGFKGNVCVEIWCLARSAKSVVGQAELRVTSIGTSPRLTAVCDSNATQQPSTFFLGKFIILPEEVV